MSKELSVSDVVAEIFQSVLATPKRQRRLLSKTLWAKFEFKTRTKERIEQVKEALRRQGLIINLDGAGFGTESKDEWIVLSYVEPPIDSTLQGSDSRLPISPPIPRPSDSWFQLMAERQFESEKEVEYYFIMPLLESLGYEEEDFAIGFPVEIFEGVTKVKKEADVVLFDGVQHHKENALLVVEAKKANGPIAPDAVGQARGYAMWLTTPYYMVITPAEIQVQLFRSYQSDVQVMKFPRNELQGCWETLYRHINKAAVIDRKAILAGLLAANGM